MGCTTRGMGANSEDSIKSDSKDPGGMLVHIALFCDIIPKLIPNIIMYRTFCLLNIRHCLSFPDPHDSGMLFVFQFAVDWQNVLVQNWSL